MTISRMTACVLLLSLCILAGCGGTQTTASNPTPTPSPATPPSTTPGTPPPPPSFPTQFVFSTGVNAPVTNGITGFKINSDGSLTASGGSSTTVAATYIKAVGPWLVEGGGNLLVFSVDRSTGAVQQTARAGDPAGKDIIPDPTAPIFHFNEIAPLHAPPVDSFLISNGQVSFLRGIVDNNGPGWFQILAVDPSGRFFYGADSVGIGLPTGPYDLAVISRGSDGSGGTRVAPLGTRLCVSKGFTTSVVAVARGTQTFLYHTCLDRNELAWDIVDNTTGAILGSGGNQNLPSVPDFSSGRTESMVADPAGNFLVMIDPGVTGLAVYAIDPNTGVPGTQPVTRVSMSAPPRYLYMDATGQYVYALASTCTTFSCTDSNSIFGFKLSGGNLSPVPGSPFKTSPGVGSITLVKF